MWKYPFDKSSLMSQMCNSKAAACLENHLITIVRKALFIAQNLAPISSACAIHNFVNHLSEALGQMLIMIQCYFKMIYMMNEKNLSCLVSIPARVGSSLMAGCIANAPFIIHCSPLIMKCGSGTNTYMLMATRCNWKNQFLKDLLLLTNHKADTSLPLARPLEVVDEELSQTIQVMEDMQDEEMAGHHYQRHV
uniref:Uncharacterized protein n=1 Tax=Romanomermis culicivorax TaxID=13658 RepID=A0A915II06_ROMCU